MTVLIGIDVGTTGVKALAVSPEGEVLGRAEEEYQLSAPHPDWSEQDPEAWWAATESVLGRLNVGDVAGIGLSGQMHGLVTLDDDKQGALFLPYLAGGTFADAAAVTVRTTIDPVSEWRSVYEDGHGSFRDLYPALKAVRGPTRKGTAA